MLSATTWKLCFQFGFSTEPNWIPNWPHIRFNHLHIWFNPVRFNSFGILYILPIVVAAEILLLMKPIDNRPNKPTFNHLSFPATVVSWVCWYKCCNGEMQVPLEDPKRFRLEMTFSRGADLSPLEVSYLLLCLLSSTITSSYEIKNNVHGPVLLFFSPSSSS